MTAAFGRRLSIVFSLVAGCLNAGPMYSIPAGYSDTDGAVSGDVIFSLTGCGAVPTPSCTLNIFITDTEANPTGAGQLISGLSFALLNAGTTLPETGTLSGTISNGSGGAVTVLDGSFNPTTTTSDGNWQLQAGGSSGFYLNDLTGGKPKDMIIGPGPYTDANSSITGHSPSYAGTVEFSISNIAGLTTSTDLSSADFYYGTGPDAHNALSCISSCGGPIVTTTASSATPEPFSMSLTGGALIALGLFRRRLFVAR